jgi:hypothetical protein
MPRTWAFCQLGRGEKICGQTDLRDGVSVSALQRAALLSSSIGGIILDYESTHYLPSMLCGEPGRPQPTDGISFQLRSRVVARWGIQ